VRCWMSCVSLIFCFFFSSRRRHTRSKRDWSSDVCSSDLYGTGFRASASRTPSRSSPRTPRSSPDTPAGSGSDGPATRGASLPVDRRARWHVSGTRSPSHQAGPRGRCEGWGVQCGGSYHQNAVASPHGGGVLEKLSDFMCSFVLDLLTGREALGELATLSIAVLDERDEIAKLDSAVASDAVEGDGAVVEELVQVGAAHP